MTSDHSAKQAGIERFEQFQSLRHRIHSEMYAVNRAALDKAQEHCRTAIDLYHAMKSDAWRGQPSFSNLSPQRQRALEEGVVELLFTWARLEVSQGGSAVAAQREAGHRRAIDAFTRIQAIGPPIPAIYLWLAESWDAVGEKQAAAEARSKAAAAQPATAMDYFVLGQHHSQHGRLDEGVASYCQMLARQPEHYLSLLAAGIAGRPAVGRTAGSGDRAGRTEAVPRR